VGNTDIEFIAEQAGGSGEDGIYMVGVGVGSADTYHDDLMDAVTDAGKGASVFIPDMEEAWTIFNQNFVNTLAVAARDVQVQLDMPPGFEIVTFSGEEWSEDPEEVEPQHLAPNDTMVFHQRIATCAPEIITDESEITVTARYKDAVTFEQREVSQTLTFAELLGADPGLLYKGAAVFAYAEALKYVKYGEADDPPVVTPAQALEAVSVAESRLPGDTDLAEIREVLEAL
jgi:Ca-activated chloride channel family protein